MVMIDTTHRRGSSSSGMTPVASGEGSRGRPQLAHQLWRHGLQAGWMEGELVAAEDGVRSLGYLQPLAVGLPPPVEPFFLLALTVLPAKLTRRPWLQVPRAGALATSMVEVFEACL